MNFHTANISKYVDYHLQPIVKQMLSYVKDINDFINKINIVKSVPENSYLVIIDVRSIYTNIPNADDNYSEKTTTTKVSTTFLALSIVYITFK